MSGGPVIAILAAGKAERFGGGKLDADYLGRPLGEHVLHTALDLELGRPLLVAAEPPPLFASEADRRARCILTVNPDATEGLGTSVALAARRAAEAGRSALLLLLADMPNVGRQTLGRLIEATATGRPAAVLHGDGHPGIPACFPASYFPALMALAGERGAATLLREAGDLALVEAPHEELLDIDTAEDLAALKARHRL